VARRPSRLALLEVSCQGASEDFVPPAAQRKAVRRPQNRAERSPKGTALGGTFRLSERDYLRASCPCLRRDGLALGRLRTRPPGQLGGAVLQESTPLHQVARRKLCPILEDRCSDGRHAWVSSVPPWRSGCEHLKSAIRRFRPLSEADRVILVADGWSAPRLS